MADLFVQFAAGTASTTTDTVTLNGVTAGNVLVAFGFDGSKTSPTTFTVSDGQGSYTGQGSVVSTSDNVAGRAFVLHNANAGTHNLTLTVDTGDSAFVCVAEITGPTSSAVSGTNAASQANPGTGTDALSSGNVTISAASTLIAYVNDTSSLSASDIPTAGTSFTSRGSNTNGTVGAWRVETIASSSTQAATGTAVTGTHNFITIAVAILNAAGGGGGLIVNPLTGIGGTTAHPLAS